MDFFLYTNSNPRPCRFSRLSGCCLSRHQISQLFSEIPRQPRVSGYDRPGQDEAYTISDHGLLDFTMYPLIFAFLAITFGTLLLFWWADIAQLRSRITYRRSLKHRVPLNNESFYDYYYSGSDIPRDIVDQLRALHERPWEIDSSTIRPYDRVTFIQPEVGTQQVLEEVEDVFDLEPTSEPSLGDETFDGIVKYVAQRRDGALKEVKP